MTEQQVRDLLAKWLRSTSGMSMVRRDRYEVAINAAYSLPVGDYETGEDLGVVLIAAAFDSISRADHRRHRRAMQKIEADHQIKMQAIRAKYA